jgi:hypothetical protein
MARRDKAQQLAQVAGAGLRHHSTRAGPDGFEKQEVHRFALSVLAKASNTKAPRL